MKLSVVILLASSLVVVSECQDLTSFMLQAMGMEAPPMLPVMPHSLREHLYPRQRQQELMLRQRQQEQQKQRYLAYLSAQQRRQIKGNPYSAPYGTSGRLQPRVNSVYSPANMIRQPGTVNAATYSKRNPYITSYQDVAFAKGRSGNPYSVSRAATSKLPSVRSLALPPPTRGLLKAMRDQPRRITDAKAAGCKLPVDSAAASMFLFSDCRNPSARMVCQAEMMTCMNVGVTPMCCPYGMNRLAMDTISYVNKLQHFMSEIA